MIRITDSITIEDNEIRFDFVRASGPGGQNINKVNSAAQLRFDAPNCRQIDENMLKRLRQMAGHQMKNNGTIIIKARRFRTQERNRQDAIDRLVKLLQKAATKPKRRKKTKPSFASGERRLTLKHHRSQIKRHRINIKHDDD